MKHDFEEVKQQINIEKIAGYLLEKDGRLYKFPGERTGSIKLYPESNSFFDFGRSVGGDSVKLWSHVRECNSWTALQEIRKMFGLDTPDRANSREAIKAAEQARRQQKAAQKAAKCEWVRQVDRLKAESYFYQTILDSEHCKPLSWTWCTCQNRLTVAQGLLDLLCNI